MEKGDWFTGPEWLEQEEKWPEQPTLARSTEASEEEKPLKEVLESAREHKPDGQAKELWVRRAQKRISQDTDTQGWRLVEE
ncbi:unnamed protein product [Porites lobata]|uniref:Uncharacterized protein n=1 Tax=Porites lobata TaxID=104759 RepID=A0ABN8Q5Q8_9CNID|nr:unnamed protein product [Porites lobata]